MKERFRQSMAWLHTWSGLVVGWVLFFVFVTGSAGYFTYEITRWMEPERPIQGGEFSYDNGVLASMAMDRLEQVAPTAEHWIITLPHHSQSTRQWVDFSISWESMPLEGHEQGIRGNEKLDPDTGGLRNEIVPRETGGGRLLYRMHYALHYITPSIAYRIIGVCTMLMLLAIVTGVITHKKIFKDFFTFRPSKGQRSWLDAHNVMSVMALPFFLMITYSGLVFFFAVYMPAGISAIYGADDKARDRYFDELFGHHSHEAISRPDASVFNMVLQAENEWGAGQVRSVMMMHDTGGEPFVEIGRVRGGHIRVFDPDVMRFHALTGALLPPEEEESGVLKTRQTILALHEGRFAEPWQRWLYFVSGLLGAGMIGTGLVLWSVKRRKKKNYGSLGHRLVEALNISTIAGLPAGVAAYFWANRLLPVEMADRVNWEMNFLFFVWGEAFIYAFFRCSNIKGCRRAWIELLWLAALAFLLLPFVNALTTDKHLMNTVIAGDWVLAGFDLAMLGLGMSFGYMAIKVKRIWLRQAAQEQKDSNAVLAGGII